MRLVIATLASALLLACAAPEPGPDAGGSEQVCEPASSRPCDCATGGSSIQLCMDDGSGWNDCLCSSGLACDREADCSADEHCHPTLRRCVLNCQRVSVACDSEPGTTCSQVDIIEPIGGLTFNGVCVCDPNYDRCPAGHYCHPRDRACSAPCSGDCSDYREARTCQPYRGTQLCLPEQDACDNSDCYDSAVGLCDTDPSSETYTECADPDSVTNFCAAPGGHDADGPVLVIDDPSLDLQQLLDPADDSGTCLAGGNELYRVRLTAFDPQGDWGGALDDTAVIVPGVGEDPPYYGMWQHYADSHLLTLLVCIAPPEEHTRALRHLDQAGNSSNLVCVDF